MSFKLQNSIGGSELNPMWASVLYFSIVAQAQEPFDQPNHYCPGEEVFLNNFRKTETNFIRYKFPFEQVNVLEGLEFTSSKTEPQKLTKIMF